MTTSGYDATGFRTVAHHDLDGYGEAMQIMRHDDALYVGHPGLSGMGVSILDVSDIAKPKMVRQWHAPEGTNTKKVQVTDGYLLTNQERLRTAPAWTAGMPVYSLDDPFDPQLVGKWEVGGTGVHRIVWDGGRYAYLSAGPEGYTGRIWMIIDMADPANPVEAGRWWWPGQADGEEPTWPDGKLFKAHHALVLGDRAYVGYCDAGMVVLDISDVGDPKFVSSVIWPGGGQTHTCMPLPGRDLVVVTDERLGTVEVQRLIHVVDVSDEQQPRVVAICPEPEGDYRGVRFGPHDFHENRVGTYRSTELVFATYFAGGLRAYDLTDPAEPRDIAHWLPPCPPGQPSVEINDILIDDDLHSYVSDRLTGGLFVLEPEDWLRERMESARLPL
jgi:hypothetical protein